ncbi:hypothetical protein VQ02_15145 [Methylobacterium variabile]|uniref:DUF1236 domain-containing protein n=1 Tax=Methylobacterium variabile TaxID=298794 RepID=A0A0J6STC2_9HYPH|nr:DUF1236 domain-containing protein [Methylobacterium variabile]KMO36613.1 hypothetical protein VQ02_15145 [Methylobacterium variabile]
MKTKTLLAAATLALTLPMAAHAQGLIGGAQRGAEDGADAAGPVGAIVGGAVGAATGAVGGLLGVDDRPRFRNYAVRQHRSYDWDGDVRVGGVLPNSGVTYYEVPSEYGIRGRRYTVVNDRVVLVDPSSRRIVQVIE